MSSKIATPSLLSLLTLLVGGCASETAITSDDGATEETSQAIIGGRDASPDEYPFMVTLRGKSGTKFSNMHFCGGTLVAPSYILTAAHCVVDQSSSDYTVTIGRTTRSDATQGQSRVVNSQIVHPEYDPVALTNDVALIRLSSPSTQTPIALASPYGPSDRASWTTGKAARAIGWGGTACSTTAAPDTLKELDGTVASDADSHAWLDGYWDGVSFDDKVEVGFRGTGGQAWKGDSGGPLLVKTSTGYKQIGVTSWGKPCVDNENATVAYARVGSVRLYRWVQSIIHNTPVVADVNGDGKADLISFTHGEGALAGEEPVYVALSDGTKLGTAQRWHSNFSHAGAIALAGDFDGDGRSDIYSVTMSGDIYIYVSRSTGGSFNGGTIAAYGAARVYEIPRVGDVDGDGKDDIVLFTPNAGRDVNVVLSRGTSFGARALWQGSFAGDGETPIVADVNGDGRADIVTFTQGMGGADEIYVALSTGTGFGTKTRWAANVGRSGMTAMAGRFTRSTVKPYVVDARADLGMFSRDQGGAVVVGTSVGNGFSAGLWAIGFGGSSSTFLVGDMNGDGVDDIIDVTQDALRDVWVAPGTGSGFGSRTKWHDAFAP